MRALRSRRSLQTGSQLSNPQPTWLFFTDEGVLSLKSDGNPCNGSKCDMQGVVLEVRLTKDRIAPGRVPDDGHRVAVVRRDDG